MARTDGASAARRGAVRGAGARLEALADDYGELSDPSLPDVSLAFALFRPALREGAGGRRQVTLDVRKVPTGFGRLRTAQTVSSLGDGVTYAALPLLAVTLARDSIALAVLTAAGTLPWLLFGVLGGALVGLLGPPAHDVGRRRGAGGAARDTCGGGGTRRAEHSAARGRRLPARPRRVLLRHGRHGRHGLSAGSARPWRRAPGARQLPPAAVPKPPRPASRGRPQAVRCSRSGERFRCSPTRCRSRSPRCSYGRCPHHPGLPEVPTSRCFGGHEPTPPTSSRIVCCSGSGSGSVRRSGTCLPRRGDRTRTPRARPSRDRHLQLRPAPYGGAHRRPARRGHHLFPRPTTRHRHRHRHRADLHDRCRGACRPGACRRPEPVRSRGSRSPSAGRAWGATMVLGPSPGRRSSRPPDRPGRLHLPPVRHVRRPVRRLPLRLAGHHVRPAHPRSATPPTSSSPRPPSRQP
ncbi:hypothetical protein ACVWXU_008465 [Streptomyces sp. TE33382]